MRISIYSAIVTLIICIYSQNSVQAEVYSWVDQNGVMHFSNWSPPNDVRSLEQRLEIKFKETDVVDQKSVEQQIKRKDYNYKEKRQEDWENEKPNQKYKYTKQKHYKDWEQNKSYERDKHLTEKSKSKKWGKNYRYKRPEAKKRQYGEWKREDYRDKKK